MCQCVEIAFALKMTPSLFRIVSFAFFVLFSIPNSSWVSTTNLRTLSRTRPPTYYFSVFLRHRPHISVHPAGYFRRFLFESTTLSHKSVDVEGTYNAIASIQLHSLPPPQDPTFALQVLYAECCTARRATPQHPNVLIVVEVLDREPTHSADAGEEARAGLGSSHRPVGREREGHG